jgi:hypothetical protein
MPLPPLAAQTPKSLEKKRRLEKKWREAMEQMSR